MVIKYMVKYYFIIQTLFGKDLFDDSETIHFYPYIKIPAQIARMPGLFVFFCS